MCCQVLDTAGSEGSDRPTAAGTSAVLWTFEGRRVVRSQVWSLDPATGRVSPGNADAPKGAALVLGVRDRDAGPVADGALELQPLSAFVDGHPLGQSWRLTPLGLLVLQARDSTGSSSSSEPASETPRFAVGLASTGRLFPAPGAEVVLVPADSQRAIRY
jgi:hypothetical protein